MSQWRDREEFKARVLQSALYKAGLLVTRDLRLPVSCRRSAYAGESCVESESAIGRY